MIGKTNLSGGENVTPEVTAQTPIVENIMTSLEGKVWEDKKGLYVWKRTPVIANPQFTLTTSSADEFKAVISNASFDTSIVGAEFFNGFSSSSKKLEYYNGELYLVFGNSSAPNGVRIISYDATTATFTGATSLIGINYVMTYTGFKIIDKTNFDYVVSDQENAYPDGGVQDGYWYKRVVDGIPLPNGYTKFAVDKFTPTSNYTGMNIPHQLGMVPKFALITDNGQVSDSSYVKRLATAIPVGGNINYTNYLSIAQGGEIYIDNSNADTKTTDKYVRFSCTSTKLQAGVEYTLITMA